MMYLPSDLQKRVVFSIKAARKYEIPAKILLTIAKKEGGKPGQWVRNSNGIHDVGTMQYAFDKLLYVDKTIWTDVCLN